MVNNLLDMGFFIFRLNGRIMYIDVSNDKKIFRNEEKINVGGLCVCVGLVIGYFIDVRENLIRSLCKVEGLKFGMVI